MLIQRPECTTKGTTAEILQYKSASNDYTDSSKMQQQEYQQHQQHVKRLLSTAAAAAGIVGDVDAIQSTQKAERNIWRIDEIREVLNIMQEMNALELLNDKMVKSEKVFRNIEQIMHRKGFRKKSHAQIWTKWKFLKSTYVTSRRTRVVPKMIPFEIYQILHKMLNNSVGTNAAASNSSDIASLDGDTSVEENLLPNRNAAADIAKSEQQNELAHPIFGFRLGLVKSEPVDTGYETTGNNSIISESDSVAISAAAQQIHASSSPSNNTNNGNAMQNFFLDIKEERVTNSPTPSSPPSLSQATSSESPSLLVPKNTRSMSITLVTSVNETLTTNKSTTSATSLPPLRIAPFANERNMTEALRRLNNSPPPLAMNSIAAVTTSTQENIIEENGTTFIRKMLRNSENDNNIAAIPPPLSNISSRPSVLRLPKEVTLQLRAPEIVTPPPPRQTIYSLRPERTVSSISSDITPVTTLQQNQTTFQQKSKYIPIYPKNMDEPMTSKMASQMKAKIKCKASAKQKKRRLNIPTWQDYDTIHPTKIIRSDIRQQDESLDESYNEHDNTGDQIFKTPPMYDQSSPPDTESAQQHKTNSTNKQSAAMEDMLKELIMSLQQTQTEMINQFFQNQIEITRKEHEYQMQQDKLIMAAFEEQRRKLMDSAEKIFGVSLKRSSENIRKNKREIQFNHRNGCFELKKRRKQSAIVDDDLGENDKNTTWQDECNYTSSEFAEDENGIENAEAAVDPIQFVTSELVEECDNS